MSEEHTDVVEIDAIAVEEWDRDQHTPVQVESNRAELVKQSGLDEGWDAPAPVRDEAAVAPRTTTNTLRRTASAPALPSKVHKTMAMPTVAAVKPATPAKSPAAPAAKPAVIAEKPAQAARPAALAQPKAKLETKAAPTKPATKTTATRVALAKPAVAPTFSPFGDDAAPAKVETMKSAPVASKIETTKSAPIARPPAAPVAAAKPARADATPAKAAPVATPAVSAAKPARPDATPAKVTPVAINVTTASSAKPDASPAPAPAVKVTAAKPARTDATPAPAIHVTPAKPARTDATPAPAIHVTAAKPARTDATPPPTVNTVNPARADATPPKTATPAALPKPAPVPSTLDLPAWPPSPRMEVAALAAGSQKFEDWDEVGGVTAVGSTMQPPRRRGEDSVIVDLNAVAQGEHQPSRRPQTYPILTSDQGTTTSGVFEMPTAEQPMMAAAMAAQSMAAATVAAEPSHRSEKPTSPAMPAQAAASSALAASAVSSANSSGSSTAWHTPLPLAAPPPEPAPQWPSAAGLAYNGAHGSAPEIPLPVTRPDPTEPHLARRTLLATVFPTPTSRKRGLLIAAGALAVILVVVLVSTGAGSSKTAITPTAKPNRATPTASSTASSQSASPTSATSATSHAATTSHAAAAAVATADTAATSSPTTTSAQPAPKKPVVAKRRISRAKKPVIVDYDKKPDPTPEQDEALSRARADYAAGNHHLFAGEADAAIVAYRQALEAYPNYVAGYRGLGLAFAQQGNRASALLAFKTYVKLAPTAKDVALINKRIANLSVR